VAAPAQTGPLSRNNNVPVTISILVPLDIVIGNFNEATQAWISQGDSVGH
jgi:hypothetical protein